MKIKLSDNFPKFLLLLFFHAILLGIILLFLLYHTKRQYQYRLYTAANTLGCLVQHKLIHDAYQNIDQNIIEYDSLIQKANRIAAIHEVTYVYALIKRNDSILFVISSYLPEDLKKDRVTYFLDHYVEAPDVFKEVFSNKKPVTYANIIDSWGSFKTIILYREAEGYPYLLCADIDNREIKNRQFTIMLMILIIFGIVLILIFLFLIHQERKKYRKQTIREEENR